MTVVVSTDRGDRIVRVVRDADEWDRLSAIVVGWAALGHVVTVERSA